MEIKFPPFEELHVYCNERGDVVLKQLNSYGGEDQFVYIPQRDLPAVIRAMRAVSKAFQE